MLNVIHQGTSIKAALYTSRAMRITNAVFLSLLFYLHSSAALRLCPITSWGRCKHDNLGCWTAIPLRRIVFFPLGSCLPLVQEPDFLLSFHWKENENAAGLRVFLREGSPIFYVQSQETGVSLLVLEKEQTAPNRRAYHLWPGQWHRGGFNQYVVERR
jgi:hypothetical protein